MSPSNSLTCWAVKRLKQALDRGSPESSLGGGDLPSQESMQRAEIQVVQTAQWAEFNFVRSGFECLNDVQYGQFARVAGEYEAAADTTLRVEYAGLAERAEDFGQISERCTCRFADCAGGSGFAHAGEVDHRTETVLGCLGDHHRVLLSDR